MPAARFPIVRGTSLLVAGIADALVSVFFPADCRLCGNVLTSASRLPICAECLNSFAPLRGRLCERCGLAAGEWSLGNDIQQEQGSHRLCPACQQQDYGFECARSYASYRGKLVRAIVLLKFDRIEPLGKWFAERLLDVVKQHDLRADLVVPVPLHRRREKERGYNQADLVARPLARKLGLPCRSLLLVRTKPRPDKHILSLEERWRSVRGAFATRPGAQVDNLRVLLVDDVMTTGATLDACARALRGAGAQSVIGLTVARATRNPV